MTKSQRRQTQNSRYMKAILDRLKEFDVSEVRLLCERYKQRRFRSTSSRRFT
jgi:hypothetical protein